MQLVTLLIGIALAPCGSLPDEPKAAGAVEKAAPQDRTDDKPAENAAEGQKKADAKAVRAPAVKAKPVAEIFRAIGAAIQEKLAPAVDADPVVQQLMPQFRPLVTTELHFVRTVCQPTPEQFKTIKAAGDASLQLTVKKYAEVQKKMQQGGFQAGQQPQWPDPRKLIAEGLAQSVKETLSADQAERYQLELEKRAAARKRVAVINLVAKLDKDLVLTAEQREKLTDSLNANWKDAWVTQLEVFLHGDQFLPALPDDQVVPILNEKQKEIWKGTNRNQNMFWGWAGFGFVQPMEIDLEVQAEAQAEVKMPEEKVQVDKKQEEKP